MIQKSTCQWATKARHWHLAMTERGINLSQASRQDMRTYVCAQCHVEYYFEGENKVLTFPWSQGTTVEAVLEHYDSYFKDWEHALTESPVLKMRHPEFELFTTSSHYKSGVACADCHMPYTCEGDIRVSDHWIRSPLTNVNNACQTCHKQSEDALIERVASIQNRTKDMMIATEDALSDAIDAIVAAMDAGVSNAASQRRVNCIAKRKHAGIIDAAARSSAYSGARCRLGAASTAEYHKSVRPGS